MSERLGLRPQLRQAKTASPESAQLSRPFDQPMATTDSDIVGTFSGSADETLSNIQRGFDEQMDQGQRT